MAINRYIICNFFCEVRMNTQTTTFIKFITGKIFVNRVVSKHFTVQFTAFSEKIFINRFYNAHILLIHKLLEFSHTTIPYMRVHERIVQLMDYTVIDAWTNSSYSIDRARYFLFSIIYMFSKLEFIIYQDTQKFNFFNNFHFLTSENNMRNDEKLFLMRNDLGLSLQRSSVNTINTF